jgi:UDPglucose--hexose-1-phosphate uridylyltransferase
MAELRREPILKRWVVITKDPVRGPADYIPYRPPDQPQEQNKPCPFCFGNEKMTPKEIFSITSEGKGWLVRVVPNKFPFFRIEGDFDRRAEGMYDLMEAIGAHEIVVESPDHHQSFATMDPHHIQKILSAYQARIVDLKKDSRLQQILILKNYPGIFNRHPHSHLLAMPILPREIDDEIFGMLDYYKRKERCIYCDIIKEEISMKTRVVLETFHFLVFCPFASRYPFETWIIPKVHSPDFHTATQEMIEDLSEALQSLFSSFARLLADPPYGLAVHTSPLQSRFHRDEYHWHIELRLRIGLKEGYEWATGLFVNPTPPENAAAYLREAATELKSESQTRAD